MRYVLLVACAAMVVSGCGPAKEVAQKNAMVGLTSSNSGSFTMIEDGSALSVLFDSMSIALAPKTEPPKGGIFVKKSAFSLRNRGEQLPLRAFFRGFVKHPENAKGKLMLSLDSTNHDLSAQVVDGGFTICVDFTPLKDRANIGIGLELPYEPEGSALLQLDSVDITVRKAREAPNQECKILTEK